MEFEQFKQQCDFNVSRETYDQLCRYEHLLLKWQRKINLISRHTMTDVWGHHLSEAIWVANFLHGHQAKELMDIGTGAGLPGFICALLLPNLSVTLVDSDRRKCEFLKHVSRETFCKVTVLNERIENLPPAPKQWITSRALASVVELLDLTTHLRNAHTHYVLLKGQNHQKERETAKKKWSFEQEASTKEKGVLLHIYDIRETSDGI